MRFQSAGMYNKLDNSECQVYFTLQVANSVTATVRIENMSVNR